MEFDAKEAVVKTATVEIRALTIRGKQVTLAMFRQLIEENILTSNGFLRGTPWGIVNYCPSAECRSGAHHLHIVWQLENELRRSTNYQVMVQKEDWYDVPYATDWLSSAILNRWQPSTGITRSYGTSYVRVRFGEEVVRIELDESAWHILECKTYNHECYHQSLHTEYQDKHQDKIGRLEELVSLVTNAVSDLRAENQRRLQRWQEFTALPQLFIAV